MLVLENINSKSIRNVLIAKSRSIDNFTVNFKMTKLNSQTKMTKSISQKVTIWNLECTVTFEGGIGYLLYTYLPALICNSLQERPFQGKFMLFFPEKKFDRREPPLGWQVCGSSGAAWLGGKSGHRPALLLGKWPPRRRRPRSPPLKITVRRIFLMTHLCCDPVSFQLASPAQAASSAGPLTWRHAVPPL